MSNKKKKQIRLCVAGTPSSGKTFLINALKKLLRDFDLTKDFPYHFQMKPGINIKPISEIEQDIKRNILKPGSGTIHTAGKEITIDNEVTYDNLYEFEYHNHLVMKTPSRLARLFGNTEKQNIHLKIRNIPGEMFDTYFKYRDGKNTVAMLFLNFRNKDNTSERLIARYKAEEEVNSEELIRFRKRFIDFCIAEIGTVNLGDILQVTQNFFSFLFYLSSTDIIVCHDMFISSSDPSHDKQENFLSVFDPSSNNGIDRKDVYYVFTKFDKAISNPELNYVNKPIKNLEDYWEFCSSLLKKIYLGDTSIKKELVSVMADLSQRDFVRKVKLEGFNKPILGDTFFVCTNYDNRESNRGFREFPKIDNEGALKVEENNWNQNNYFNESYPLGVLELLMCLINRSGNCGYDKQELKVDGSNDLILRAFID